jgi:hypothetical protein
MAMMKRWRWTDVVICNGGEVLTAVSDSLWELLQLEKREGKLRHLSN